MRNKVKSVQPYNCEKSGFSVDRHRWDTIDNKNPNQWQKWQSFLFDFSWKSMSIANTNEEKIPFISSILHFQFFRFLALSSIFQRMGECRVLFFENSRGGDVVSIFALFIAFVLLPRVVVYMSYLHLKLAQSCAKKIVQRRYVVLAHACQRKHDI